MAGRSKDGQWEDGRVAAVRLELPVPSALAPVPAAAFWRPAVHYAGRPRVTSSALRLAARHAAPPHAPAPALPAPAPVCWLSGPPRAALDDDPPSAVPVAAPRRLPTGGCPPAPAPLARHGLPIVPRPALRIAGQPAHPLGARLIAPRLSLLTAARLGLLSAGQLALRPVG